MIAVLALLVTAGVADPAQARYRIESMPAPSRATSRFQVLAPSAQSRAGMRFSARAVVKIDAAGCAAGVLFADGFEG